MNHMLVLILALCSLSISSLFSQELIPAGTFQTVEKGWVKGFSRKGSTRLVESQEDGRYIEITKPGGGVDFSIPLKPEWGTLRLETEMRVTGLESGEHDWMTGRIPMSFHDASGRQVGGWPNVFGYTGTTDWKRCQRDYKIPKGAASVRIGLAHFGKTGTVAFKPISFRVLKNRAKWGNAPLPEGAPADPWSIADAWKVATPERTRICLNGLWGFRPVLPDEKEEKVPVADDNWGWGKIPSVWSAAWETAPVQRLWYAPWLEENVNGHNRFDSAWYCRTFTMPAAAKGRRVVLTFTMLQTFAKVWVDGHVAGELIFPGGEIDLTKWVRPGEKQRVEMLVRARPLDETTVTFMAPERAFKDKAHVALKGITGDLYLDLLPKGPRVVEAYAETSVQKGEITFVAETESLSAASYRLVAEVTGLGTTKRFERGGLTPDADGRIRFTAAWKDPQLWDIHTPQNRYQCQLSLYDERGKRVDAALPFSFGFREVRTVGRDLHLNGTPIHLRALHNNAMNKTADQVDKRAAEEVCRRLKQYGFNAIIAGNYNFSPGTVSYMDALLEACDASGILFSFSLPHIRNFKFKLDNPEIRARYETLTRWVIRRARNHPSVILYGMNHNATGYFGDQNPLKIDGIFDMPREGNGWWIRSREQARISQRVAAVIDSTRPIYHHESGNLGDLFCINIYLNWAPKQERSDWLQHWSEKGVKPLFFVEWGLPHVSSWSSFRGPEFIWRSPAFQSLWASEYSAEYLGEAAYEGTPETAAALAHEEKLWAKGEPFLWSRLNVPLRSLTNLYHGVQSLMAEDNWRCHRAWGATAMLPWDQGGLWKRVAWSESETNALCWTGLKNPGIVPDRYHPGGQFVEDLSSPTNFVPSVVGKTFLRWNQPDCAFIGGGEPFTDKRKNYRPGEEAKKRLVLINDRRVSQKVGWRCQLNGVRKPIVQTGEEIVRPGEIAQIPIAFTVPDKAGRYRLDAVFTFADGVKQTDSLFLDVVAREKVSFPKRLYLYDPKGMTVENFKRLEIPCIRQESLETLPAKGSMLVIGRGCLEEGFLDRAMPQVREGLRVVVMEQESGPLTRAGFRIAEHGLRHLYPRYHHGPLREMTAETLRDWAGESTLLPPYLADLQEIETHDPRWKWCGFTNTRVWRCRNRGAVASVLLEKPTAGNWCALVDGGFDLQYSPLLYRAYGSGGVLFCQLDVTGRTIPDPQADEWMRKMLTIGWGWGWIWPEAHGVAAYNHCVAQRVAITGGANTWKQKVWIVSSGVQPPADYVEKVKAGQTVVCLGLTAEETSAWSPIPVAVAQTNGAYYTRMKKIPHELNGLSQADWAWHGAMDFAAFTDEAEEGNAAFRVVRHGKGRVLFWQVPPWKIDVEAKPYLRTSRRHAEVFFARLLSNLGCVQQETRILYQDIPRSEDDPYRYYRW